MPWHALCNRVNSSTCTPFRVHTLTRRWKPFPCLIALSGCRSPCKPLPTVLLFSNNFSFFTYRLIFGHFFQHSLPSRSFQQVSDITGLSCDNSETPSVVIASTQGSIPSGTSYDTYVYNVDSSEDGEFEHVITDLTPGNVSFCCQRIPHFALEKYFGSMCGFSWLHVCREASSTGKID